MDYTITPIERRSVVRRLAPWAASLGLFAGGGYGVYRYALPTARAEAAAPAPAADTPDARLMAAMPVGTAASTAGPRYTTPFDPPRNSYAAAPALPPAVDAEEVATPRSAAAIEQPINPFATMPVDGSTDRYGSPAHAAPAPSVSPAPLGMADDPAPPTPTTGAAVDEGSTEASSDDVARGQEPSSSNPLRSTGRAAEGAAELAATGTDAARAAFTDGIATDAALPVPPESGAGPPVRGELTMAPAEVANGLRSRAVGGATTQAATDSSSAPNAAEQPAASPTSAPATIDNPWARTAAAGAMTAAEPSAAAPQSAEPTAAYGGRGYAMPLAEAPAAIYAAAPTVDASAITPTPGLATADGTGRPGERQLEGLQTPTLVLQKSAPPEIQVGKKCTFYVRVQNNSQRTAHQVVVTDEVPLGTQLIGTAPKANVSGSQVAWDLGTLSAGEERIVEMELMPTAEGELGSVATVSFASQASAKTRCTRPQLALRLSANPHVMIGEQQIVQVEVTNPGSGDATGVMLLENIPPGVTHEAGPALEFPVGTLRPGETRRLDLVLNAREAGIVDNVMTARADANLQIEAACRFEVLAPELKVVVNGPGRRFLERPATYTISIDNPGTAPAKDVQLVTQLPKGLQFVSANEYGEYDAATHSVYWSLSELPANLSQPAVVELTALPVEAGEHTLQVATRAAQGLEDRAEAHVLVDGIVALTFEVQDVSDAIEVGGQTTYEIRVENQGSKTATNVQVVAAMPPGLRAQAGEGDARYTVESDRVVFAPLPQLAPKADSTLRFRVQGLRAGDQRVTLQVTTDEVREPITEVESTQVYADE